MDIYKIGNLFAFLGFEEINLRRKAEENVNYDVVTLDEFKTELALKAVSGKSLHRSQLRALHYLEKQDIPLTRFTFCNGCFEEYEKQSSYKMIHHYYLGKRSKRSKVPYINHIDEGLELLSCACRRLWMKTHPFDTNDTQFAIDIYCLHPIAQNGDVVEHPSFHLAQEYARVANAYLSKDVRPWGDIELSTIDAVNLALAVDKLQNYSDLRAYHRKHPRYPSLEYYFKNWLGKLQPGLEL